MPCVHWPLLYDVAGICWDGEVSFLSKFFGLLVRFNRDRGWCIPTVKAMVQDLIASPGLAQSLPGITTLGVVRVDSFIIFHSKLLYTKYNINKIIVKSLSSINILLTLELCKMFFRDSFLFPPGILA